MADSPFYLPASAYKRELDILRDYVSDQARYLATVTARPLEQCVAFVKAQMRPGGQFEFKDPRVLYAERDENGDRTLKEGTLSQYLAEANQRADLIAPTLTTYLNPKVCPSLLVEFIDDNVAGRKVAKKKMFAANRAVEKAELDHDPVKAALHKDLENIYDKEQTNKKLANNAVSGAHLSASQPLYNPTGHSTLTSTCRATAGFGNANNEKLLSGNRHYWSVEIVLANIVSIINHTDYPAFEATLAQYDIVYPSVEQTLECIRYSTNLYWLDQRKMAKIERLVRCLTPIERAAFVYTGDFYHLMRFNETVAREFLTKLAKHVTTPHPDPASVIKTAPEALLQTAQQICEEQMRGYKLSDLEGTLTYGIVAATAANMLETLDYYTAMIRTFWCTTNVPSSLAWFPTSIRRAALTGDTDSTIFTVQDWVEWFTGELKVDPVSNGVAAAVVFLSSQTIIHLLARMSANFGIEEKRLFQIAMKNEYKFDVFTPTQVGKHYFALIGCREGNLYAKYEKEIKGVHLKSSNAPRFVTKMAEKMMVDIMHTVLAGKKISLSKILKQVADVERDVVSAIAQGNPRFFRKTQIKPADAYKKKNAEETPYLQYMMWNEVFGPDYGMVTPPPYICVRIATEADTPAKTKEWLDGMENQALAQRMRDWMLRYNKKYIGSVQLPEQIVASKGVPKEILAIAGVRKIVKDTTKIFYIILEALNFFILDEKKISRLVSDYH